MGMAVRAGAFAMMGALAVDASGGAGVDIGYGVQSEGMALQRVVMEGMGAGTEGANGYGRFDGTMGGSVAKRPTAVALLKGRAVAKAFDMDSLTE
jgi:hypothetical protein